MAEQAENVAPGGLRLDGLPADILQLVVSRIERPHSFFQVSKCLFVLSRDNHTYLSWLVQQYGLSRAAELLTKSKIAATWDESTALAALKRIVGQRELLRVESTLALTSWCAAERGFPVATKLMLDHGFDINQLEMETFCCLGSRGRIAVMEVLLPYLTTSHLEPSAALNAALLGAAGSQAAGSETQQLNTIAWLLQHGASLHAQGGAALRNACFKGYLPAARMMLSMGADPHAQQDEAIRSAAFMGHVAVVQELARHGADVCSNQVRPMQLQYCATHPLT